MLYSIENRPTLLAPRDTVHFSVEGRDLSYEVRDGYLNTDGPNRTIFTLLGFERGCMGMDETRLHAFAAEAYGYSATRGGWPVAHTGDYEALTRLVNALFGLIAGEPPSTEPFTPRPVTRRVRDTAARVVPIGPTQVSQSIQYILAAVERGHNTPAKVWAWMLQNGSEATQGTTLEEVTEIMSILVPGGTLESNMVQYVSHIRGGNRVEVVAAPPRDLYLQVLKFLREQPTAVSNGTVREAFSDYRNDDFELVMHNLSHGDASNPRLIKHGDRGWYTRNDNRAITDALLESWDASKWRTYGVPR